MPPLPPPPNLCCYRLFGIARQPCLYTSLSISECDRCTYAHIAYTYTYPPASLGAIWLSGVCAQQCLQVPPVLYSATLCSQSLLVLVFASSCLLFVAWTRQLLMRPPGSDKLPSTRWRLSKPLEPLIFLISTEMCRKAYTRIGHHGKPMGIMGNLAKSSQTIKKRRKLYESIENNRK